MNSISMRYNKTRDIKYTLYNTVHNIKRRIKQSFAVLEEIVASVQWVCIILIRVTHCTRLIIVSTLCVVCLINVLYMTYGAVDCRLGEIWNSEWWWRPAAIPLLYMSRVIREPSRHKVSSNQLVSKQTFWFLAHHISGVSEWVRVIEYWFFSMS